MAKLLTVYYKTISTHVKSVFIPSKPWEQYKSENQIIKDSIEEAPGIRIKEELLDQDFDISVVTDSENYK